MLASQIRWVNVKSPDRSSEKAYRSYGNDVSRLVVMCVLPRVAASCSVLQCVAVCCSVWQCVAACCSVLQHALSRRCITHMVTMCRTVVILKSSLASQLTTENDSKADFQDFL